MYEEYTTGTRVLNLRQKGENAGQRGYVIDTPFSGEEDEVYVRYDNGNVGHSDEPERYYKIIASAARGGACTASDKEVNTKPMKSIVTFVKNALLSANEKLLRKHGLKTECGDYTEAAKEIVINNLCRESEDVLVEAAKAFEAEQKADKE